MVLICISLSMNFKKRNVSFLEKIIETIKERIDHKKDLEF